MKFLTKHRLNWFLSVTAHPLNTLFERNKIKCFATLFCFFYEKSFKKPPSKPARGQFPPAKFAVQFVRNTAIRPWSNRLIHRCRVTL